jgi:hypothetical protein
MNTTNHIQKNKKGKNVFEEKIKKWGFPLISAGWWLWGT